ncbi:DUF7657 domain-containing protein [Paenibacillus ehimensis]|uniref:DUF7657 domain-containing protein n=1 Tax=Paenibacillus ehimensis TaxID=79264 RepID=UPI000FDA9C3B|nr:hypothetical protein [Paenibacillus ehimensis]
MKTILQLSKRVLICLALLLVGNLIIFSTFKSSAELYISNKGQAATINFLYDNFKEGYPFDDSHMTPDISLQGGGIQKVAVPVSLEKLNKLRIDFGTIPQSFEIHSLSIIKSPLYEIKISGDEFLKRFSNKNDISNYMVKDGIVNIHTSGTDGHIYSLGVLENSPIAFRQEFFQQELFFVIATFLFVFIDKVWLLIKSISVILFGYFKKSKDLIQSRKSKRDRILGFILVIFYSSLSAFLLDVVILRFIAIIARSCGFDTLYRYFSPAFTFSLGRVYFFFIFIFVAGLLAYLGKKKAIRYRYAIAFLLLVLLVCGRFTGSSLGAYDGMLQGNSPNFVQSTLLGIPQGIRGDEWATEKPYYFAQVMSGNELPYFNNKLSFNGNDMVVSAFAPVKDIIILARPDLWGFLILPPDFAFSFYWCSRLILLFMASFEMGLLLTRRYRYALLTAMVITFAPPVQWWLSQALMLMLMSGQFAVVCFNNYLKSKTNYGRILNLLAISFFALVYIFTMYPATQVPLAYIFLALLIYLCIENKNRKPLAPLRLFQYMLMMAPVVGIIVHFYTKSKFAIHTMMNTTYPGTNRPWIPLPWDYDLYQFVNVFTASIRHPHFLNSSEISQFYSFIPFVILISTFLLLRFKRRLLLLALLLGASVILWLFSWMPQISIINKITLMDFTYPVRITYAYGFGFTLLVVALLPLLEKKIKFFSPKTAGIISGLICFLTLCILTNSDNIFGYYKAFTLGTSLMVLVVILMSYMGYLLLSGGKKRIRLFSTLLLVLSVGSTCMVNPITQGIDAMFAKSTMAKIREIDAKDSGRWMVSGNPTISNLVTAQGVARTTGTYYYPDWTMMRIIDKELRFVNLWNQFAHIDMRLTDGTLDFSLFDHEKSAKVNETNRIIYIPIETARELKIKYIFTSIAIPQSIIDRGEVTLLYQDKVDPWSIYRVN